MSNYKSYLLRAMGMTNTPIKPSIVERNNFPGIDPDELEKGTGEEEEEHDMSPDKARQTAAQHLQEPNQAHYYTGVEKAKKQGMLKDIMNSPLLSPTAIATPVIGVAVRGSVTGGLPSGADQVGDISPSRLGGYEKIPIDQVNSKLVDKTPENPEINSSTPINDNPKTDDGVTHPFQVQRNAGEVPQAMTGASTDSDDTLKLKSAVPKGIDIDIGEADGGKEENKSADGTGDPNKETGFGRMNEMDLNNTFARHKKLMKETLKNKKSTCDCEKAKKSQDVKENVGANEPFSTKWKMDPEKAGMVKVDEKKEGLVKLSEAFERMRGLANLGERRVMSSGLWGNNTINEVDEKGVKCKVCGKTFTPTYGEYQRCPDCLASQHADGERATGVQEENRMQPNVSQNKIPTERLNSIKKTLLSKSKKGTLSDKELKLFRKVNAALNMRGED